jgi:murein DD-endopeptidase MepM/ murein hydrolase activator NlpD
MREDQPRAPWWLATWMQIRRLFPERQILLRTEGRLSYIRLSTRSQAVMAVFVLLVLAWTSFGSITVVMHRDVVAAKEQRHAEIIAERDRRIEDGKRAQQVLLEEFDEWKRLNRTLTVNLEDQTVVVRTLTAENRTLRQELELAAGKLAKAEGERDRILAEQTSLDKKINGLRSIVVSATTNNSTLKDHLDSSRRDLLEALAERNQIMVEANRMRRQISELETRLGTLQDQQLDTVQRLSEQMNELIDGTQRIVKLAGLEVSDLLVDEDAALPGGQGGPFVPTQFDGLPADRLKAGIGDLESRLELWQRLQGAVRQLPLAPPLAHYYVTSTYGKRRDPVNGRWAMHYGIDFGNSNGGRDPALATAPGVVEFAGWRGNYGKVVEIDHGSGIKTRYGHLHKVLVKKGDVVKFHDKIGLVGSTGRTTGAHLHYEISVNGKPRDPANFIRAGRYVFQSEPVVKESSK